MLFFTAVSFDRSIISDVAVKCAVLSAIETAMMLVTLFRAEALTPAGRMMLYTVARRFMEKMLLAPFKNLQVSGWALFKFHSAWAHGGDARIPRQLPRPLCTVLMHLVNALVRGAPASTNSGTFEAALRLFISRVAKRISNNHNLLRDAMKSAIHRAVGVLLRARGVQGAGRDATLSCPARRVLIEQRSADYLQKPLKTAQAAELSRAVKLDWGNVANLYGTGATMTSPTSNIAAINVRRQARWVEEAVIWRPNCQFAGAIRKGSIIELDPADPHYAPQPPPADIRSNPATAKLARVEGVFYMGPPPADTGGGFSDGFPLGDGTRDLQERMFVLVWSFAQEKASVTSFLRQHDLIYHTVRGLKRQTGAPPRAPLRVFRLASVLRTVRALPVVWPSFSSLDAAAQASYGTPQEHRKAIAAGCMLPTAQRLDILVFWTPTDTFIPNAAGIPAEREGNNDGADSDVDDNEQPEED